MPLLSDHAKRKKVRYFFSNVPKDATILEIGCGNGWLGQFLKNNGWAFYRGLDIHPPADIIGDINNWKNLGIRENSFDIIVAFEVIEHIDCFRALFDILKPEGQLFLTSPIPHMDTICKFLEWINLNQKRTSPHNHLVYFKNVPLFCPIEIRKMFFLVQWGKFKKI